MKKFTALLLAVAMLVSLNGCFGPPEIVGTYETEVDLKDLVVENFDRGFGTQDDTLSLANYLSEFSLTLTFVFNQDGTYQISVAPDSIVDSLNHLKSAVLPLMEDLIFHQFQEKFTPFGFGIESHADLEAIVGMTWDEVFQSAFGKSEEQFIADLVDESFIDALTTEFVTEGNFKAKDGKLYLSKSLDTQISEDSYETYKIEDGYITILEAVNVKNAGFFSYPYILTELEPLPSPEAES